MVTGRGRVAIISRCAPKRSFVLSRARPSFEVRAFFIMHTGERRHKNDVNVSEIKLKWIEVGKCVCCRRWVRWVGQVSELFECSLYHVEWYAHFPFDSSLF